MRTRTAMELISTLVILLLAWVVLLALDLLAAGLLTLVGAGFKKVFCWGLLALLIPPLMMLYGILVERNCYRVVPVEVPVEGLPEAFDGYRIAQISDLHLRSYRKRPASLRRAVKTLNGTGADLIAFTGDLVTMDPDELDAPAGKAGNLAGILSGIQAPDGVMAILGNHDYLLYGPYESEADRQERLHERREHLVAVDLLDAVDRLAHKRLELDAADDDVVLPQREAEHAGDEEEEDRAELQRAAPDRAAAGVREVLRGERALDDELVGAPVPDADRRRGDRDAEPRERLVRERVPQAELLDVARRLDRLLEDRPAVADGRGDRARLRVERHARVAEVVERKDRHGQRAREDDARLHEVGVDDGGKSADGRVDAREDDGRDRADPERGDRRPADRQLHLGEHHLEEERAREDGHGNLGEDVRRERDEREDPARPRAEAPLEELGHRGDAALVVEREEHPAHHDEHPCVQLPVRLAEARRRARPREADQVLGADVRGEDRRADREPPDRPAAEEEVLARFDLVLAQRHVDDARKERKVARDDQPVDECHDLFLLSLSEIGG